MWSTNEQQVIGSAMIRCCNGENLASIWQLVYGENLEGKEMAAREGFPTAGDRNTSYTTPQLHMLGGPAAHGGMFADLLGRSVSQAQQEGGPSEDPVLGIGSARLKVHQQQVLLFFSHTVPLRCQVQRALVNALCRLLPSHPIC